MQTTKIDDFPQLREIPLAQYLLLQEIEQIIKEKRTWNEAFKSIRHVLEQAGYRVWEGSTSYDRQKTGLNVMKKGRFRVCTYAKATISRRDRWAYNVRRYLEWYF